jgi:beta-lactam-binding protein with PASTA domain
MPKVVVYVRMGDARQIEDAKGKSIEEWVRELVAYAVDRFKEQQVEERT